MALAPRYAPPPPPAHRFALHWTGMVVILAIIAAATFLFTRAEPAPDKCTSVLYLQGKPISAELALKNVTLKGSVSPAAQEVIGKDLQDYAQRAHTFCMMHEAGAISNSEYRDEIVQINSRTMAIMEASSRGALSSQSFTDSNLDAIVYGALRGQPLPGPFVMFFDWEKADITPEAASLLDNVAKACRTLQDQGVPIVVSFVAFGGGDNSPDPADNDPSVNVQNLPVNRLISLMRYMRKSGANSCRVPGVVSVDQAERSVPVADGVREPQMRRVEVTFMRQI